MRRIWIVSILVLTAMAIGNSARAMERVSGTGLIEVGDIPVADETDGDESNTPEELSLAPKRYHKHLTYYSGDQNFTWEIIEGGPVRVIAMNPRTGKEDCCNITLPSGVPDIIYKNDSITYSFTDQDVSILFTRDWCGNPKTVKKCKSKECHNALTASFKTVHDKLRKCVSQPELTEQVKETSKDAAGAVGGAKDGIGKLGAQCLETFRGLFRFIPGMVPVESMPETDSVTKYLDSMPSSNN